MELPSVLCPEVFRKGHMFPFESLDECFWNSLIEYTFKVSPHVLHIKTLWYLLMFSAENTRGKSVRSSSTPIRSSIIWARWCSSYFHRMHVVYFYYSYKENFKKIMSHVTKIVQPFYTVPSVKYITDIVQVKSRVNHSKVTFYYSLMMNLP